MQLFGSQTKSESCIILSHEKTLGNKSNISHESYSWLFSKTFNVIPKRIFKFSMYFFLFLIISVCLFLSAPFIHRFKKMYLWKKSICAFYTLFIFVQVLGVHMLLSICNIQISHDEKLNLPFSETFELRTNFL